jgi:hypothetical protein
VVRERVGVRARVGIGRVRDVVTLLLEPPDEGDSKRRKSPAPFPFANGRSKETFVAWAPANTWWFVLLTYALVPPYSLYAWYVLTLVWNAIGSWPPSFRTTKNAKEPTLLGVRKRAR